MKKLLTSGRFLSVVFILLLVGCETFQGGDRGRNHGPVITSLPGGAAMVDEVYGYGVKAWDGDGDILGYVLARSPEGMSVNPVTGEIRWTPKITQVGNHVVEVAVKDGQGGSASQVFTVRVNPLDNGVPFQRGFTLVGWQSDGYLQPQSDASLLQMKADGVEYVSILVSWFQDTTGSTTLAPWDVVTPSDAAMVHAITYAHSLGLKVALKPDVNLMTGEWRGQIYFTDEADWAAWFASYNQFVGHYLNLAEANHVEVVNIGTELKMTEGRTVDWRNTIALARTKFSGPISYCANHDSFYLVSWWDAVDFIGISAYFRLTDKNDPTVEEIKASWELLNKKVIRGLAAYYDRDVVFMEIGYQSRDGANQSPWGTTSVIADPQEQADCYQAVFETFYNEPWFKGMYWWAWSWDPGVDAGQNGFDVYNKPAEDMVKQWYSGK